MNAPAPDDPRPDFVTTFDVASSVSREASAPVESEPPSKLRLSQLLLDPRGLHALMASGGGLLALGLVIWLAVNGLFDHPLHAAIGLGAANFALLGGGVWVAAKTRYRTAGRATAMLACLVMPLNLWFYDAQGLVTLAGGGSLWVAALVCCIVYAGVARVLKDSLFVYAFTAGAAMTGLLFLADGNIGHFWEVLAPSTLLVVLGVVCIHAERLFPKTAAHEANAAFTRDDFGRAFLRAGHVLLASGLGVLFAGRLVGRFYDAMFADLGWFDAPHVATVASVKLAALILALVGTYSYGYSRFIASDDGRRYTLSAALSLAWSGVIGIDLLGFEFTEVLLVGLLGALAVACELLIGKLPVGAQKGEAKGEVDGMFDAASRLLRATGLALLLLQLMRGVWMPGVEIIGFEFTWGYVAAAATMLVAQAIAAFRQGGETASPNRWSAVCLSAIALTGGAVSLLPVAAFGQSAALILAMAAVAAVASGKALTRPDDHRAALLCGAEACGWLLVLLLAPYAAFAASLATLAATATLAGVFVAVSTDDKRYAGVVAALLAAAAAWQAIFLFHIGIHLALVSFSTVSLIAIALDRLELLHRIGGAGRIGLILAATAGGLLAGNRLLAGETTWQLLGLVSGQALVTGVAVLLSKRDQGRDGLIALCAAQVVVAALVVNTLSVLSLGQKLELFSVVVGSALVVAGLIGWRREAARESGGSDRLTDANLWIGSLLAATPITIGLVMTRLLGGAPWWIAFHELGVLTVGLALVGVGVLCRLRATTLTGVASLTVYVFSLATLLQVPDQLQNVAVYLMAGGGAVFGSAVLMSVYRDRLLAIPERIREGEGVFAVLKWR